MATVEPSPALRIGAIRLNVANLELAAAFYEAGLGFSVLKRGAAAITMSLGGEQLDLVQAPSGAAPYPSPAAANDLWFQHFAIRVSDMGAAYRCLSEQQQTPISVGGPQQLPTSTGSVIAYKFRDPDGHPLELSFAPGGPRSPKGTPLFLTIDHTAIAVANVEKSLAFWVGLLGFRETARLLNQGPTQWRLDGLKEALVDIVVLEAAQGSPHVELLHYRQPVSAQPTRRFGLGDIGATRLRLSGTPAVAHLKRLAASRVQSEADDGALVLLDPDGHLVELSSQWNEPCPASTI